MAYNDNNIQNESDQYSILSLPILKSNLRPITKLVFAAIVSHYRGENSTIFPSYNRIAGILGISRNTAIVAVRELVAARLLTKEIRMRDDGGFSSNVYMITPSNLNQPVSNLNNTSPSNRGDIRDSNLNQPRNKRNLNNNINLKIYNTRATRAKNAAAVVLDTAELELNDKDREIVDIFKQAKGWNWFNLLRIQQTYYLRPITKQSLQFVSNAEFNNLLSIVHKIGGNCHPLNIGSHYEREVKLV